MKTFKQYNESLRDKMTPVNMKEIIGDDDIYENVYKKIEEKSKEIKPPFKSEIRFAEWNHKYITLKVTIENIHYLSCVIRIKDGDWYSFYTKGSDNETQSKKYDTWDDLYKDMLRTFKIEINQKLEYAKLQLSDIENDINIYDNLEQKIKELM